MRSEAARFLRFGVVGASNTLLTLLAFAVLTRLGVVADAASALAFVAGAANGYLLNRSWTFHAAGGTRTLARYVPVQVLGALASATGVRLASTDARLHRLVAECVVLPFVTVLTYTLSRRFVFRTRPTSPSTPARPAWSP